MEITNKRIHFVGIGGVGMSGIAKLLLEYGCKVSGSDYRASHTTEKLKSMGADIFVGHSAENVRDPELVVYSSAISPQNPEILACQQKGITLIKRGKMLAELMKGKTGIAISGMHGKTTTTSLVSIVLQDAGLDPTFIIGADVSQFDGNFRYGKSELFVAEADESDGSFLYLEPIYSVITNIEMEHLDYYRNINEIIEAYLNFANKTNPAGCIFWGYDCENVRKIYKSVKRKSITYGLRQESDFYPDNISMERRESSFDCFYKGKKLGKIFLQIPGAHNIANSLAAVAVGLELGVKFEKIQESLFKFKGANRRFELKGDINGIMVIEDYAHHPTEVKATINAAKNWKDKRIVVVFQPHRYSRAKYLKREFGACFHEADVLIMTDLYSASEEPIEGVDGKSVYNEVVAQGHKNAFYVAKGQLHDHVLSVLKKDDMLIVMGAGDIGNLSLNVVNSLKSKPVNV